MTVLITGGSRGIGAAIADRLAARNHDLVLVARDKEALHNTAEALREKYGVLVTAVAADLTKQGTAEKLKERFEKKRITITGLVNNAAFGYSGHLTQMADQAEAMIRVNVVSLTELTRAFLASIERSNGFVINVSSVAGLAPVPSMAVYAATKSYVVSFTESLSMETSARVVCICPGPVDTEFHTTARTSGLRRSARSSEDVAIEALRALDGRSVVYVTDPWFRWAVRLTGWMPRSWVRRIARRMMRGRS